MAKPHLPTLETRHTLSKIRRDLYGLLSSAYIEMPEKTTFELRWEPAFELLRNPQKGSEEAFKQIQKGLNLVNSYRLKKNLPDMETLKNLSKDWTHLFRGVVRNGILPPYESLYRAGRLQKGPVQDINRLFSKMGVQIPEEWHQPSDYIGVELDFMRLLCEKELKMWKESGANLTLEVVEMERSFLENHLGLWLNDFCQKMVEQAREDYYRGVARLSIGLVEYDRVYTKKSISSSAIRVR
jgi:TorA maturation chaperone TorD